MQVGRHMRQQKMLKSALKFWKEWIIDQSSQIFLMWAVIIRWLGA